MSASTVAFAKFYIGTAKVCASAADYASDTWLQVNEVTDLGEIGDEATEIKYNVIGEARTKKLAGTRDAGDFTVTSARDNTDPGQMAMNTAASSSATVNFKATTDNGATVYFAGLVLKAHTKFGQANGVVERMWSVAVSVQPIEA